MFDSLTVAALVDELSLRLLGGHIQKVLQLDDDSIGLEIYAEHRRQYLVVSASSRSPKIYLSSTRLSADPSRVSPLLLLLRKYARGAEIVSIQQPPLERVVRVSIAKRFFMDKKEDPQEEPGDEDDISEIVYTDLVIEIMGRRSNIILVNEDGKILDCIKRVTTEMSRVRPVLPGRQYELPPPQDKRDPRHLDAQATTRLFADVSPGTLLSSAIVTKLAGFSPQMAREAAHRATSDAQFVMDSALVSEAAERLSGALESILEPLDTSKWEPAVYRDEDGLVSAFSPIHLQSLSGEATEERLESMSGVVELVVESGVQAAPIRHAQRRAQLVASIEEAVKRAGSRVHSIEEEQRRARQVERWREYGEAIYAHIHEISVGQSTLVTDGHQIELDPSLSPSDNAQSYFERYRKAQSATQHLPELEAAARGELGYLEQLRTLAELADGIDQIEAVRREWEEWRQPRSKSDGKRGPKKTRRKQPVAYQTKQGETIYVGHSGPENETVTFDLAGPDDVWLHARGLPGAHVVLRSPGEMHEKALEAAASLAAWYSSGRTSTRVEVDATQRRYVRKIKGAGPGMVTYRNEQTLNVKPRSADELGLT